MNNPKLTTKASKSLKHQVVFTDSGNSEKLSFLCFSWNPSSWCKKLIWLDDTNPSMYALLCEITSLCRRCRNKTTFNFNLSQSIDQKHRWYVQSCELGAIKRSTMDVLLLTSPESIVTRKKTEGKKKERTPCFHAATVVSVPGEIQSHRAELRILDVNREQRINQHRAAL